MVTASVPPRRVSYVLPPPKANPPLLGLPPISAPRRGQTNPLYTLTGQYADNSRHTYSDAADAHPRHRLAVQALAIDFSTAVTHEHDGVETQDTRPGGILYTGGRDGLLCSWELGLPTKRRRRSYGQVDPDDLDEDEDALDVGEDDDDDDDDAVDELGPVGALELEGVGAPPQSSFANAKHRSFSTSTTKAKRPGPDRFASNSALPLQHRWEIDSEVLGQLPSAPRASFRQCVQSHTDWVNDIVLANYNRTLVSASSDSSILAWHPHSTDHHDQMTPTTIGRHADYVRCLATGLDTNWVASGGFDRKIKLWDVGEGRANAPIVELPSPPASVYSLGTTPSGSLVAAGSPERVVRVWDPRSRKQVSRLGGHTDNVRAVLLADDGKWLLSASSDSTVKLWSLAAQKCLHTFSHHNSSVWSLFSQHSSLEIFYSGDRDGNLCKVDFAGTGEPTEGECILLARDGPEDPTDRTGNDGITQMVAQDDTWVWTVGGSSSVKRWKDVLPKLQRAAMIVRRAKESGDYGTVPDPRASSSPVPSEIVASPTETSPSPASPPSSPPVRERPPSHSVSFLEGLTAPLARTSSSPTPRSPSQLAQVVSSAHRPSSLRASRLSVTTTSRPAYEHLITDNPTSCCDIPYDSLVPLTLPEETYFAPAFASRYRDPDAATIYSTISRTSGSHRPPLPNMHSSSYRRTQSIAETTTGATNIAQREYFERESVAEAVPLRSDPDDVIEGGHGLVRCELLNDRQHALTQDTEDGIALWDIVRGHCVGVFAPNQLSDALSMRRPSDNASASGLSVGGSVRSNGHVSDLLDYVRERIEGEVSIATWCKCDTRVGALTVHLEEARVFDAEAYLEECGVGPAEDYPPDHRLCLGKWVLRQLFDGFIEAEMSQRMPGAHSNASGSTSSVDEISSMGYVSLSDGPPPMSPRARMPRTPGMTIALATPATKRAVLPDMPTGVASMVSPRFGQTELAPIPQSPAAYTPMALQVSMVGGKTPTRERPEGDYFSLRPSLPPDSASNAPASPTTTSRTSEPPTPGGTHAPLPTPGGGNFMGRLRMLGKNQKKNSADVQPITTPTVSQVIEDTRPLEVRQQEHILETVFSRPLAPCPLVDAPRLSYDPDMAIIISEETGDAWSVKYRGLVGTSYEDMPVLEQNAPLWLLDFLLGNRTLQKEPVKVSFVLQAWKGDEARALPDMPNANARLTANRSLRVRKVCSYVADKLSLRVMSRAPSIADGLNTHGTSPTRPSSAVPQAAAAGEYNPETGIEILVNGEVLPTNVTIGTVRHCMWKSGGDVVFSYRLKEPRGV
ncbi:hypothetical protein JCM3774_001666 [Rhodotorula dairenensis]